jgi:flagellar hook-length control protein FliK
MADAASHAVEAASVTIPERDVVAQLVQSLRVQFRDGIGEAVVRLKPEHLGSVQISLTIENGAIRATVQAEVAAVRQWLESQQDTLRTNLAEQGLRLERFVVQPDGERQSRSDDAQERELRRRHQRTRTSAAMSGKDHPVFEITV